MINHNISDEDLAAYLDGNVDPSMALLIESSFSTDNELVELCSIHSDISSFGSELDLLDFGLSDMQGFFLSNNLIDSAMNNSILGNDSLLGDTLPEVHDIQQQYPDTCAIKSQQIILNEFGIDVTEDQLVQFSYEQGWYNGDGSGTSAENVGNLLESANIPVTRQDGANVFNLVSELSQGHKVIVGVDSEELWGNKFMAWIKDFFMGNTPDHALVVAGIDTSDPDNVLVIVDDPGSGEYHKAYPLDQFMDAWSDAECYMVSTNVPVPEYSPAMANFDYGQGHIPVVGGMDYADFQIFNDLSYGLPVCTMVDGVNVYPTSSLMDAYFDVANNDLAFNDIFADNYMFNDYLNTDIATQMMQQTYQENLGLINFNEIPNYPDIATAMSNQDYENYLHGSIDYFQGIGDFDSAMLCQQQLMMIDYCDNYDIDFYSTFIG